jgi:type I restriction enzyme S subunit
MPSINAKNMYNLELFVPSYNDQVKIDEILTTWDLAIDKIIKIKQELTTFKDSIIKKYTLPSYIVKQEGMEWIEVKLKDILVEENEKTTINNQYDILTSTVDSIVLQSEYFNRQIASKNNKGYKIVKKDRLVISPQNAWMGNININTKYDIGIVSPSYKIYKLNDVDCKYFKHYVKTEMFRVLIDSNSQTGASIVRKSLKIGDLLSTTLKLPDIDIQKKLGSYFDEIDELIIKYNELHQEYERQKQGLMQQLLTGKMKIEKD